MLRKYLRHDLTEDQDHDGDQNGRDRGRQGDVILEKIDSGKVGDKLVLSICRVNSDYTTYEFDVEITLVEDKGESSKPAQTTIPYIDPFEYFNQFGY